MSDLNLTEYRLDLDTGDFLKKSEEANESISQLHADIHTIKIAEMFEAMEAGVELAEHAFHALKETLETVLEQFLEAEKIKVINYQFEQLSKNAGISSSEMKEGFEKAAAGMIPLNDILAVANKALINMGASGKQLPQLFELAQNQARAFGKDALESFESINRAVEFGNQRMLRTLGIKVDLKKAEENYAHSVGFTGDKLADNLTEEEKIRARIKALIDYQHNKMVKTPEELRPISDAWARMKTQITEFKEALQAFIDKSFGPMLQTIMAVLTASIEGYRRMTQEINRLLGAHEAVHAAVKKTGDEEKKQDVDAEARSRARVQRHNKEVEDRKKGEKEFNDEFSRLEKARFHEEESLAKSSENAKKAENARNKKAHQDYVDDIRKIDEQDELTKEQRLKLYAAADKKNTATLKASHAQFLKDSEKQAKAEFDYKTAAAQAFTSNYRNSLQDLVSGQKDAGDAIKGLFLGALGDMAMKQGEFMMLDAFKTFPIINVPELAAGGALIALGAELGSLGGGSASQMAASAAGGYGATTGGENSLASAAAAPQSLNDNQAVAKKTVTIQVAGNYFETEETRRHLTEIIRQNIDATDFNFRQIGQA